MLRPFIQIVVLASLLTACAHRGAVRVDCEGPLRPINRPSEAQPPVTVAPASDAPTTADREKQP
jgi:hypothetical protein